MREAFKYHQKSVKLLKYAVAQKFGTGLFDTMAAYSVWASQNRLVIAALPLVSPFSNDPTGRLPNRVRENVCVLTVVLIK